MTHDRIVEHTFDTFRFLACVLFLQWCIFFSINNFSIRKSAPIKKCLDTKKIGKCTRKVPCSKHFLNSFLLLSYGPKTNTTFSPFSENNFTFWRLHFYGYYLVGGSNLYSEYHEKKWIFVLKYIFYEICFDILY